VRVMDFGLARLAEESADDAREAPVAEEPPPRPDPSARIVRRYDEACVRAARRRFAAFCA